MRRALALLLFACATPPKAPAPRPSAVRYEVVAQPPALQITATFENASPTLVVGLTPDRVERREGDAWIEVPSREGAYEIPACASRCTVRYLIDLRKGDFDLDHVRSGSPGHEGYLAASYAWMLRPEPMPAARIATVVHAPSARDASEPATGAFVRAQFMSGLAPEMTSRDFGEGSFTAFGELRRAVVREGDAALDVTILGDRPLALGDAGVLRWSGRAAHAVAALYGRFPAPRAALFVVPVHEADEVVFGKVLSLGGPSIATFVGTEMKERDIDDDWVLVHEMIHLGFPTFLGEGRWLGEGVATYYEPILRARAGITSGAEVWKGFARSMPRAEAHGGELALEKRGDIDSVYWGGALFCYLADVRIRKETRGQRSLDDVMRGIFAKGGDATTVWRVADVLREGDAITGTHVLTALHEELAVRGSKIDARAELAPLGVGEGGALDDRAPLAWIRAAIAP